MRAKLNARPDAPAVRYALARALVHAGEHAEARDHLTALSAVPEARAYACLLLAVVEQRLGRRHHAIAAFREAIKAAGAKVPPRWRASLAGLLIQEGRYETAAKQLEAALRSPDAAPSVRATLARTYWRLDRLEEALEAIEPGLLAEADAPAAWRAMAAELRRSLDEGRTSKAASADYSDAIFRGGGVYGLPAEETPYYGFWLKVAEAVRESGARRVLDLGCGPGQFAEFLLRSVPDVAYTGVDFSSAAVELGRERAPAATFVQADLSQACGFEDLDYDLVVALEVLEHIDEDQAVLGRLRRGARIIASVPSYDSFGHVRWFRDAEAVRDRYGEHIADLFVEPFQLAPHSTLFLMRGRLA